MTKKSAAYKAAKFTGVVLTTLIIAAGIVVAIADNTFVTHAAAKVQHDMLQAQAADRMRLIEEREDLHYKEVTRRLEKIDGHVMSIHNILLTERKK